MAFERDLGDGAALVLRTPSAARALRPVIAANLPRLRLWEPWAHVVEPGDLMDEYDREQLRRFVDGTAVPGILQQDGNAIGSVSAQIDRYTRSAQLGYWVDERAEGKGIVARACRAVIGDLFADGVERIEIRTAGHNERSIRLAERLGFAREGTLRRALPVGTQRHDLAVFGLLSADADGASDGDAHPGG
ncbi:ribosomal-protein-serine acetyltransferase [Microbacterium sp. ZKA21]|uniref:GNAT family N-acetyltransferase n=1 Tax=Microbacterium sp. ZKA21 TaxID=3381694 RepID=UPI003D195E69